MRNLRNQTPENDLFYALSKKEKPDLVHAPSLTHFITFGHVQPTYTVGWRDSYWEDLLSTVSVCVRVHVCVFSPPPTRAHDHKSIHFHIASGKRDRPVRRRAHKVQGSVALYAYAEKTPSAYTVRP